MTQQEVEAKTYPLEAFRTSSSDDDTTLFQRAADSMGEGEVLTLNGDGSYDIEHAISRPGKSWRVHGNGATIMQRADTGLFNFVNQFAASGRVTAINYSTTHDYSNGDGVATPCAKITVDGSPPAAGTWVKIVSDDALTGSDAGGSERRGEMFMVGYVNGSDVYTLHPLRDTYTTSPRLAVMNTAPSLVLRDLVLGSDSAGDAGGWTSGLVNIEGYFSPLIENVSVLNGWGPALSIIGCLGARGINLDLANLLNDPDGGRFGYGWNDVSSEYSMISMLMAINCRHGFTTNCNAVSDLDTRFARYGRSAYGILVNSVAVDCCVGFDTHGDAWGWLWEALTARGSPRGRDAVNAGFQFRGWNNKAAGCRAIDTHHGFSLVQQYAEGAQDCEIIDFTAKVTGFGVQVIGNAGGAPLRATFDGLKYRGASALIAGSYCDVTIERPRVKWSPSVSNQSLFRLNYGCKLRIDDFDIDMSGAKGGSHRFATCHTMGGPTRDISLDIGAGEVRGASGNLQWMLDANSLGGSANIGRKGKKIDVDSALASNGGVTNFANLTSLSTNIRVPSTANQSFTLTEKLDSGSTATLAQPATTADEIFIYATPSQAGDGYNGAAAGAFVGQKMTIFNRANRGGENLALTANFRNLFNLKATRNLTPGTSATLVWDHTGWVG